MTDARYARVFDAIAAALSEVNATVPLPRHPLRKRLLWKLRGVPADVRAAEIRTARARADLLFDATARVDAMARARDTLAGSSDE